MEGTLQFKIQMPWPGELTRVQLRVLQGCSRAPLQPAGGWQHKWHKKWDLQTHKCWMIPCPVQALLPKVIRIGTIQSVRCDNGIDNRDNYSSEGWWNFLHHHVGGFSYSHFFFSYLKFFFQLSVECLCFFSNHVSSFMRVKISRVPQAFHLIFFFTGFKGT